MADVITFATTGVTYYNGSAIGYVSPMGVMHKINPHIEHNVIASQSGILNTRFDDVGPSGTTYYSA